MIGGAANPVFADFADGETAMLHRVRIEVTAGAVELHLPDGGAPVIWPLGEVRRLPDQAGKDGLVLGLEGDQPARLMIADKELATRLAAACPDLERRHRDPDILRRLAILSVAAVTSVAVIVFALVPLMANQLATMLPTAAEQAFGDTTYEQIRKAFAEEDQDEVWECAEADGLAALQKMADRLTRDAGLEYELRLHVLDMKDVNAFALPGGHVTLLRGLLEAAESPEEVAAVLAHEIGHVEHRDPTRLALRSAGSVGVLGLLLGDFAGGLVVLYVSEWLIQASYSRGAEAAADSYAHAALARAGLPAEPMAVFFQRLLEEHGDADGLVSHLASHPDLRGRAEAARAADMVGTAAFTPVLSTKEWAALRAICD
jgi:Zn-dependent protease with chaperone function